MSCPAARNLVKRATGSSGRVITASAASSSMIIPISTESSPSSCRRAGSVIGAPRALSGSASKALRTRSYARVDLDAATTVQRQTRGPKGRFHGGARRPTRQCGAARHGENGTGLLSSHRTASARSRHLSVAVHARIRSAAADSLGHNNGGVAPRRGGRSRRAHVQRRRHRLARSRRTRRHRWQHGRLRLRLPAVFENLQAGGQSLNSLFEQGHTSLQLLLFRGIGIHLRSASGSVSVS